MASPLPLPEVRTGQGEFLLARAELERRFRGRFSDPDIHLVQAGTDSCLDRYMDYFGPYATSHDKLDEDPALQEEVRNAARALLVQVLERRAGHRAPDEALQDPRPK